MCLTSSLLYYSNQAPPAENDAEDPAQPNRFNAVIEKIERLYMVTNDDIILLHIAHALSSDSIQIARVNIAAMKKILMMYRTTINMTLMILLLMMLNWSVSQFYLALSFVDDSFLISLMCPALINFYLLCILLCNHAEMI